MKIISNGKISNDWNLWRANDRMDLSRNNAYPTPFADNPILPLLLLSLARQKISPTVSSTIREEYDYIIVGAGSAGSVVASRLSEIPCVSVLLLEAGKPPPLLNEIPALARSFWFTDIDWQYKTVPQKHSGFGLVNRQLVWPSGKGLGGTSLLNGMVYMRGNRANYDDWARDGAVGWSYSDVFPYFLKLEDNRDPEYLANGYHRVDGPISAHKPRYEAEIKAPILETARHMGYKVVDSNGRRQTGFFDQQGTFRDGQRCSTAKAYLVPAENRTNLDIVPEAFVKKVLLEGCIATGVEFDYQGFTYIVKARREVILSAGTTNTAQLLMLSGIGPKEHLESLHIPVEQDLPVGNNLQDHVAIPIPFQVDPRIPSFLQKVVEPSSVEQYIQNRTGVLTSNEATYLLAFLNGQIRPEIDFPDFELYFVDVPPVFARRQFGIKPEVYQQVYGPYENSTSLMCFASPIHPRSRGTVRLRSANPYDPPLIDPNYFSNPDDMKEMIDAIKTCLKIGNSDTMRRRVGARRLPALVPGCEKLTGDRYLECMARTIVITTNHQVGTARMGEPNNPYTVVDPLLKVKGMENLRVVDASVMPTVPFGNTNIPTIMVAEKASDIIKSTINCYTQNPFISQNEFPSSPYYRKPPLSPNVVL